VTQVAAVSIPSEDVAALRLAKALRNTVMASGTKVRYDTLEQVARTD
jgi:hypothetical protein